MERNLYLDVYTILNWIQFTIPTICAFRVLNPHQWSLARESSLKIVKWCIKSTKSRKTQKGWCNKPTKLQFQSILTRKIMTLFFSPSGVCEIYLIYQGHYLYQSPKLLWFQKILFMDISLTVIRIKNFLVAMIAINHEKQ